MTMPGWLLGLWSPGARINVLERFNLERMAKDVLQVYEAVAR